MSQENNTLSSHQFLITTTEHLKVLLVSRKSIGTLTLPTSTPLMLLEKCRRSMQSSWRLNSKWMEPCQSAEQEPRRWKTWTLPCTTTTTCGWSTISCTSSKLKHFTTSEMSLSSEDKRWSSSSHKPRPTLLNSKKSETWLLKIWLRIQSWLDLLLSSLGDQDIAHHLPIHQTLSPRSLLPLPSLESD